MDYKKVSILGFLLIFSCAYSASQLHSASPFAQQAFQIAKSGSMPPLLFLANADTDLGRNDRAAILRRLVLTGNGSNMNAFLRFRIVKPKDITLEMIQYAQDRVTINPSNQEIQQVLLQHHTAHRVRKAQREKIRTQEEIIRKRKAEAEMPEEPPSKKLHSQEPGEPETCRICLDEYTESSPAVRMVPESKTCQHTAHAECFANWRESADTKACIFCGDTTRKRKIPIGWMEWVSSPPNSVNLIGR